MPGVLASRLATGVDALMAEVDDPVESKRTNYMNTIELRLIIRGQEPDSSPFGVGLVRTVKMPNPPHAGLKFVEGGQAFHIGDSEQGPILKFASASGRLEFEAESVAWSIDAECYVVECTYEVPSRMVLRTVLDSLAEEGAWRPASLLKNGKALAVGLDRGFQRALNGWRMQTVSSEAAE